MFSGRRSGSSAAKFNSNNLDITHEDVAVYTYTGKLERLISLLAIKVLLAFRDLQACELVLVLY